MNEKLKNPCSIAKIVSAYYNLLYNATFTNVFFWGDSLIQPAALRKGQTEPQLINVNLHLAHIFREDPKALIFTRINERASHPQCFLKTWLLLQLGLHQYFSNFVFISF